MAMPRPFKCGVCSQEFTRSENLQRHRTSRHGGTSRHKYECTKCHSRFHRRDVCKRHEERCNGHVSRARSRHLSPQASSRRSLWSHSNSLPDSTVGQVICNSLIDEALYPAELSETSVRLTDADVTGLVESYFSRFHHSFPILHRPTFSAEVTNRSLQKAVVVIGSLYSADSLPLSERDDKLRISDSLWECGRKELQTLVSKDRKEFQNVCVMQAFLLHIIYGVYRDDGSRFEKARRMFRILVDNLRDLELLHQTTAVGLDPTWEAGISPDLANNEDTLDAKWAAFVSTESLKHALYATFFIDSQVFKACNLRPILSGNELGWELPHASCLWEADTSHLWLERLYEDSCGATIPYGTGFRYEFQGQSATSLTVAMQSLMSASPCPHLIRALSACPFAALCAAANLDCLVQDFTRCYYQLPPSLSDPSAFHILSQSQNKSITAALRSISSAKSASVDSGDQSDLWHAVNLMTMSIRSSLCNPDDLLIGGIVDNSITAALATSAHLILGSYFASRRSTQALGAPQELNGAGGLNLLAQLMPFLDKAVDQSQKGTAEGPWTTVVTIKLLLALWKALRHIIQHLRRSNADDPGCIRKFDPARVTLHAIAVNIDEHMRSLDLERQDVPQSESRIADETLEHVERSLLSLSTEICKLRSVWPAGPSVAKVLEDIMNGLEQE